MAVLLSGLAEYLPGRGSGAESEHILVPTDLKHNRFGR